VKISRFSPQNVFPMFGFVTRTVIEICEKNNNNTFKTTRFFSRHAPNPNTKRPNADEETRFSNRDSVLLTQFDRRRSADDDRDDNAHKTAEDFPRASSHIVRFPVGEAKCVSALTTAADWTPLREQCESGRERVFLNRTIAIAVLPPPPYSSSSLRHAFKIEIE